MHFAWTQKKANLENGFYDILNGEKISISRRMSAREPVGSLFPSAGLNGEIIGQSAALRQIIVQIEMVAPTDVTVLILGETGTGKELLARELHRRSRRKDKPLVPVNCACPRRCSKFLVPSLATKNTAANFGRS